jgi:hypothetical protein
VGDAHFPERNGDHPRVPPQLAIGDGVDAGRLLEADGLAHGAVLDGAELIGVERALPGPLRASFR